MSRRRGRVPALSLDDLDTWLAGQPDIARRNWTVTSIDGFCAALLDPGSSHPEPNPASVAGYLWTHTTCGRRFVDVQVTGDEAMGGKV